MNLIFITLWFKIDIIGLYACPSPLLYTDFTAITKYACQQLRLDKSVVLVLFERYTGVDTAIFYRIKPFKFLISGNASIMLKCSCCVVM